MKKLIYLFGIVVLICLMSFISGCRERVFYRHTKNLIDIKKVIRFGNQNAQSVTFNFEDTIRLDKSEIDKDSLHIYLYRGGDLYHRILLINSVREETTVVVEREEYRHLLDTCFSLEYENGTPYNGVIYIVYIGASGIVVDLEITLKVDYIWWEEQ